MKILYGGTGAVIFEDDAEGMRETVENAVRQGIDLAYANLAGAKLRWANLTGARLAGARLAGAKLTGARLVGAKLTGADLTGVRLYDVCLAWATMTEADLDRIRDRLTKEQTASIKIVEAVYAQAN